MHYRNSPFMNENLVKFVRPKEVIFRFVGFGCHILNGLRKSS